MNLALAGDHADRQAAADDLAVGGEVGPDTEIRLRAARVHAEAGDHLVEDQRRDRFRCVTPRSSCRNSAAAGRAAGSAPARPAPPRSLVRAPA